MKSRYGLFILLVFIAMLVLAVGGGAAPSATEPLPEFVEPAATEAPAYAGCPLIGESVAKEGGSVSQDSVAMAPMPTAAAYEISNPAGDLTVVERSNRMIIKNADVRLMVKDTDVAIDRATQIIGDALVRGGPSHPHRTPTHVADFLGVLPQAIAQPSVSNALDVYRPIRNTSSEQSLQ